MPEGLSVGFTTAAALVHELMEARDERRLLRLQKQMAGHKLLIIDELAHLGGTDSERRGAGCKPPAEECALPESRYAWARSVSEARASLVSSCSGFNVFAILIDAAPWSNPASS